MIFLFCGPSYCGKTYYIREYLLPTLLTRPRELTEAAPERFGLALIDDPPSRKDPLGQYPGKPYQDVSDWRRADFKSRVSRFDEAEPQALCRLALERGDTVLVLDEIDLRLPSSSQPLSADANKIVQRGRHNGVALVGSMRRLHSVHAAVRANCQVAYFGNLAEPEDRKYAAKMASVDESILATMKPQVFLEHHRLTNRKYLTKIEGKNRVVLETL